MKALLLIDIQNDFLPGGSLAVPQGDDVVHAANRLAARYDCVVATQDWHPADHASFASQHARRRVGEVIQLDGLDQVLWPDHCVQGTLGAELAAGWTEVASST
jgi:nicotinamidase/pyrazinamidase